MQTINLSHERKLIYIGSTLYPLKGVLIAPMEAEPTINTKCKSQELYRSRPIVGEDWRVVDDSWYAYESECGFANSILDPSKGPVSVNHPALTDALSYAANHGDTTPLQILEEAERMGLKLTNEGLQTKVHLVVEQVYQSKLWRIGNSWEVWDEYDYQGSSSLYYVPDHTFNHEAKSTHFEDDRWVYNLEDLLFRLKHTLGAYSDFFHVKGLSVDVSFDEEIPDEVRAKICPLIAKLNDYLRFIDDINQYED